jgi:aminoglycoside phosphotransferase (APT) family kinase protein
MLAESEALALEVLQSLGLAPTPVVFFPAAQQEKAILIYTYLPGELWQGSLASLAVLMRRYHHYPVAAQGFRLLAQSPRAIVDQAEELLADCQEDALVRELRLLRPKLREYPSLNQPCLVHTDAWVGNFIGSGQQAYLIDWQCPGLGDPVEDVWTLLESGYQQLINLPLYTQTQKQQFLEAYSDTAVLERLSLLSPYFAYRVAAHSIARIQDLNSSKPQASQAYKKVLRHLLEGLGA